MSLTIDDITIRHTLQPGDLGYIIHRHGVVYSQEHGFGVKFEAYVAESIAEFYLAYNPEMDKVWICEHNGQMIGFLALMHRESNTAQLRFFYVEKPYRGIGLGKKLMKLFMTTYHERGYTSCYLLTTDNLDAAASLYTRNGFELTKEFGSDIFEIQVKERRYDLR